MMTSVSSRAGAQEPQIRHKETVQLLLERAKEAKAKGEYIKLADIWNQLYLLVPTQPMALYNAGRAAEEAGDNSRAVRHYQEFLRVAAKTHPNYRLATARLEAAAAKAAAEDASVAAERALRAKRQAEDARRNSPPLADQARPVKRILKGEGTSGVRRTIAWGAVVVGGLAAVGGGVMWTLRYGDKTELEDMAAGRVTNTCGSTEACATAWNDADDALTIWRAVTIGGVVVAGVGAVLLATLPDDQDLVLSPLLGLGRFGVQVRF